MRSGDSWPKPCPILWLMKMSQERAIVIFTVWVIAPSSWSQQSHSFSSAEQWIVSSGEHIWTICFQDTAHQTPIFNEWIFMECMHVFITLCSTVSTINVSTQVEPCFVHKTKKVQHIKSLTLKSTKPLEILNSCSCITCYKLIDI